jgi:hypothetical protein
MCICAVGHLLYRPLHWGKRDNCDLMSCVRSCLQISVGGGGAQETNRSILVLVQWEIQAMPILNIQRRSTALLILGCFWPCRNPCLFEQVFPASRTQGIWNFAVYDREFQFTLTIIQMYGWRLLCKLYCNIDTDRHDMGTSWIGPDFVIEWG